MKKSLLVLSSILIACFTLYGCSDSSSSAPAAADVTADVTVERPTDYSTGPMQEVPAIGASKTLQDGTADTHEVETDGDWIVWRARSINLSFFDGSTVAVQDTGLNGATTMYSFGDCDNSPVLYDGTTIYFLAHDVGATNAPGLYSMAPGGSATLIASLPAAAVYFKELDDVAMHKVGSMVYLYGEGDYYDGQYNYELAIYSLDLSAATPAFTEVFTETSTDYSIQWDEGSGGDGYMVRSTASGVLTIGDLSDGSTLALTGDGTSAGPSNAKYSNGTFTWTENSNLYYYRPATMDDSALVYDDPAVAIYSSIAGPDYIIFGDSNNDLYYIEEADFVSGTPTLITDTDAPSIGNMVVYQNYVFFAQDDPDNNAQLYMVELDWAATPVFGDPVQVSDNGEGSTNPSNGYGVTFDGTTVFANFTYKDVENPSDVLIAYNVGADTLTELTGDADLQKIAVVSAGGGKAVFLHRDHAFRLFAKKVDEAMAPITITPAYLKVTNKFSVSGGVVAMKAMDRRMFIDGLIDPDDFSGDDLSEIYYIDLDAAGDLTRITFNVEEENHFPMTNGSYITWTDYDDYGWLYNINTGDYTYLGDSSGKIPVDGNFAAWEYNSDIYVFNLTTKENSMVHSGSYIPKCPSLKDGIVAWGDDTTDEVWYMDLTTDTPTPTLADTTYNYGPVRTDGDYLVWRAYDTSDYYAAYEIATNTLIEIPLEGETPDLIEVDVSCYPLVTAGKIIFAAEEYGVDNPDGDQEIFYCDLTAAVPVLSRVTDDAEGKGLWDSRPRVGNGVVVWRTGGASSWDWKGKTPAACKF